MSYAMTDEQRFLFDTRGYFVVPNVLSATQIETLKHTIKGPTEQFPPVPQSEGPLHWDRLWRDLLDLPALSPILEEVVGNPRVGAASGRPSFRLDHINVHTHVANGFKGGRLHGGWNTVTGFFRYDNGRFYNGLTTVSFELYDTRPNDGGFACIPGSHKGNVPMPAEWTDLSQGIAEPVVRVAARPGDAIIFTEAIIHGTLPWTVDAPRSTVFYKFSPHALTWSADYFEPDDFRRYTDMDDRKLAILEPPNARYPHRPTAPAPRDDATRDAADG